MGKYIINGGKKLSGEINVMGSKNAALPILAATVLNSSISCIHNCPQISDSKIMIEILKSIGCKVSCSQNTVTVDSSCANLYEVPKKYIKEMRSSIIFLGSLVSRFKKTIISYPGGCELGPRPIDLHLNSLKKMGVSIKEEDNLIICEAQQIKGTIIDLDFPSVGATENIMLTAVLAKGDTIIKNAAKEPEIVDLANFLNSMGAKIHKAGTDEIYIKGVEKLNDTDYTVMSDRIVAGTFLIAAAITKGEILIKDINTKYIYSILLKLKECGCNIDDKKNSVYLKSPNILKPINIITAPYPDFPTDMQPQFITLLSLADGTSTVIETIFKSRYKYISELSKMGVNICIDESKAIINGVKYIKGANLSAMDLRGGAALIIGGLAAEGKTIVNDSKHIQRGYENIQNTLNSLGADISFVE